MIGMSAVCLKRKRITLRNLITPIDNNRFSGNAEDQQTISATARDAEKLSASQKSVFSDMKIEPENTDLECGSLEEVDPTLPGWVTASCVRSVNPAHSPNVRSASEQLLWTPLSDVTITTTKNIPLRELRVLRGL